MAVVLMTVAACTRAAEHTSAEIQVGYLPISAGLPLFVAIERGLFEAAGLKVHLQKYANGGQMVDDVVTGRLAAASPGPADVYLAKEVSTPGRFKIYLTTAYTPDNFIYSVVVREDSGIGQLKDLRGKRIGVFPGVTNRRLFEILLQDKFGWIPDKDFEVRAISASLQLDALIKGEYDAICALEPTGTVATFNPRLKMIERGPIERNVLNPLYITAHALSTRAMTESPAKMGAFVTAMESAVQFIRKDEVGARNLLPKYTFLTAEQAAATPIGDVRTTSETNRSSFQQLADLLQREGVLGRAIAVDGLLFHAP